MSTIQPHGSQYSPGDRVQVFDYSGPGGTRRPWYVGTVVSYWRNDCFKIREDQHGTTCCYHVSELELI